MPAYRRTATFDAVLVYMDEPQVVTLVAQKSRIIAVAIHDDDESRSMFLATTVGGRDWAKYLEGTVDLRYLFTVPTVRRMYTLDLQSMRNNMVKMELIEDDEVEDEFLPSPRFFAENHTEHYSYDKKATDPEKLIIDGEWELTDLGQFQQKFSDVYTFVISERNWQDGAISDSVKRKIQEAFIGRPFQGGSSYLHLFRDLGHSISRADQLNLNEIQYASPGFVEVFGRDFVFSDMREIIGNFLLRRDELMRMYSEFHKYLSENNYLKMRGGEYGRGDPSEKYILREAKKIASAMLAPDFAVVHRLTGHNALVSAKIVLAFHRRLAEATLYFAQGRITYEH